MLQMLSSRRKSPVFGCPLIKKHTPDKLEMGSKYVMDSNEDEDDIIGVDSGDDAENEISL